MENNTTNTTTVTKFLNEELVDFASYSTIRAIASYVDGLKNSHRKVLHYMLQKGNKETKVSNLVGPIQSSTEYLHGDISGSIITLARNFVGTNNLPLFTRDGNFGSRYTPEPSAIRYISTENEKYLYNIFHKEDNEILTEQVFEGTTIEPKFYIPSIPLLLVNGSEGIATGFAQKILPRNITEIKEYITKYINGTKSTKVLIPYFNGFNGVVEKTDEINKWLIKGMFNRKSITSVEITELPIGYTLESYTKVLNDLEDKNIIRSYKDFSENDKFTFIVNIDSKSLKSWSDDEVLDKLKLVKKVSENYTCIDENSRIREFNSIKEILNAYCDLKLTYIDKRKANMLDNLKKDLLVLASKYIFIKSVIDGDIIVNNKKKKEIIEQIEANEKINKVDDSYEFLLRMPLYSLTEEKIEELLKQINNGKEEYKKINTISNVDMWISDLGDF